MIIDKYTAQENMKVRKWKMTFRNPRTCRRKHQKSLAGSMDLPGKPWSEIPSVTSLLIPVKPYPVPPRQTATIYNKGNNP